MAEFGSITTWIQLGATGLLGYVLVWVLRNQRAERDEWRAESREHRDAMFQMLTQVSDVIQKTNTALDAHTREHAATCQRLDAGFAAIEQALAIQKQLSDIAHRVGAERPKSDAPKRPTSASSESG